MGLLARVLERTTTGAAVTPGRGAATAASPLTVAERRAVWACASWLIEYPRPDLLERTGAMREIAAALPAAAREGLVATLDAVEGEDLMVLQESYVATFDTRRRGCLHLTYFSQGDTRRRGLALVRIKQDFRAAGVEVGDDELPDHLGVVLEFAAGHDAARGEKILRQNRPGLELLRLHLEEVGSPWAGAIIAVCATLPPLDLADRDAVMRLAAEGPAEETVGLDGYGTGDDALPTEPGAGAPGGFGGEGMPYPPVSSPCSGHSPARPTGPVDIEIMEGRPR